ncbi:unnamed protein product, partial [marine sediment metagenome]
MTIHQNIKECVTHKQEEKIVSAANSTLVNCEQLPASCNLSLAHTFEVNAFSFYESKKPQQSFICAA